MVRYSVSAFVLVIAMMTTCAAQADSGGGNYAGDDVRLRDGEADCNSNGLDDSMEVGPLQGHALRFDGSGDYVDPGASTALTNLGQGDFTIEAWVCTNDQGHAVLIGNAGHAAALWNFVIRGLDQGGVIRLRIIDGVSEYLCDGSTSVNDGAWHHVAAVRLLNDSSIRLYVDGTLDAMISPTSAPFTATNDTLIGRDQQTSPHCYDGLMDELRVWGVGRDQAEIAADMYRALDGTESGLVAYWRFDEGTGSVAHDSAGDSDGTLVDSTAWLAMADDCNSNGVLDECDLADGMSTDCNANAILDECEVGGTEDCNENSVPDLCDIYSGLSVDCNSNGIPDECEAGGTEDCDSDGISDLCDIYRGNSEDCNGNAIPDECETLATGVVYVDDDAGGGQNNGTSWTDAFVELSDALAFTEGCGGVGEIRVAGGTYTPGPSREDSFYMQNNLAVRGGYRGLAGVSHGDDRDIDTFVTILSGDIGSTDDASDNCYHVVVGSFTDASAVLDGVTITVGNDDRPSPNGDGGGIYTVDGSPTFIQCTISGNSAADDGGGMYNDNSSPSLTRCVFMANQSGDCGGGIGNIDDSNPVLDHCTFYANSATYGGGMNNYESNPTLTDCVFNGNSGTNGGAMRNYYYSKPTLTDCIFNGNWASNGAGIDNSNYSGGTLSNCTFDRNAAMHGGGMHNYYSSPELFYCTFVGNTATEGAGMENVYSSRPRLNSCLFMGNSAGQYGGGMNNFYSSGPVAINCMFKGNSSGKYGGAIENNQQSSPGLINCTISGNWATAGGGAVYSTFSSVPRFTNCIVWGNGSTGETQIRGAASVNYSCVQGGWDDGTCNIGTNPLLDNTLRPMAGSPCIDAGSNDAVPTDYDDLDGDGDTMEPTPVDLDGRVRFFDDPNVADTGQGTAPIVDMGAYERSGQNAGSADLDGDGDVDLHDFALFVTQFTGPQG